MSGPARCPTCGWMVDTPAHELGCQGYPGPTPPRPEPVATDDLVAQARREARDAESRRPGGCAVVPIALLFAIATALEDTKAERDRALDKRDAMIGAYAMQDARLAKIAAERDRAHATLRELEDAANRAVRDLSKDAVIGAPFVARLARERLEADS